MAVSASFDAMNGRGRVWSESAARRRAFRAAQRHSRLVRILRIMLPAACLLSVAGVIVATRFVLPGDIDLSAARLSVTRNSIIMDNPHLTGFDGDRRQYSLSADRAIQALTNPDEVRLEAIEASIVAAERGATTITAEAGEYDHGASTLNLLGGIAVSSSDGYALMMTDADIDFAAETLKSPNRVSVRYGDSEISAEQLSATEGGEVILFEGNVLTTLMPPKRNTVGANAVEQGN